MLLSVASVALIMCNTIYMTLYYNTYIYMYMYMYMYTLHSINSAHVQYTSHIQTWDVYTLYARTLKLHVQYMYTVAEQ